jgi:hypothetical protein
MRWQLSWGPAAAGSPCMRLWRCSVHGHYDFSRKLLVSLWWCVQVVGAVGFANQRLALPSSLDARVAAIINHCWASEAAARPSFTQV